MKTSIAVRNPGLTDDKMPAGSWKTSSKNAQIFAASILKADLQKTDGSWNQDSVVIHPGEVYGNNDGSFFVEDNVLKTQHLPAGSWKDSAKNYKMIGNVLYAQLKTVQTSWKSAHIEVVPGKSYKNNNGQFTVDEETACKPFECFKKKTPNEKPHENLAIPGGSWIKSALHYTMKGNILTAELQDTVGSLHNVTVEVKAGQTYGNENGKFVIEGQNQPQNVQTVAKEAEQTCSLTSCFAKGKGAEPKTKNTELPGGSWRESARSVKMDGNTLSAVLKDMKGLWNQAAVTVKPGQTFGNDNGEFVVEGQSQPQASNVQTVAEESDQTCSWTSCFAKGKSDVLPESQLKTKNVELPGGSWKQSARSAEMDDNVLQAQLQDTEGNWNNASVTVKAGQTFGNNDGSFVLEGTGKTDAYQKFEYQIQKMSATDFTKLSDSQKNKMNKRLHELQNYITVKNLPECPRTHLQKMQMMIVVAMTNLHLRATLPGGSWAQSARNYNVENGTLSAQLQNKSGFWKRATIKVKPDQTYGNDNGKFVVEGQNQSQHPNVQKKLSQTHGNDDEKRCPNLTSCCARGKRAVSDGSDGLPGGSWRQSARKPQTKLTKVTKYVKWLNADLQADNGEWKRSVVTVEEGVNYKNVNGMFYRE